MRTSRYIEEMDKAARKSLIGVVPETDGRTLLVEANYTKDRRSTLWKVGLASSHFSYLYMLAAGTLPTTWMLAYPFAVYWSTPY